MRPPIKQGLGLLVVAFVAMGQETGQQVADLLRAGKDAEAAARADSLLGKEPHNPALWTYRGLALSRMGQTDASLKSFDKALVASPGYLPALRGAAQTAYSSRSPRASEYLERLLKVSPSEKTAHAMSAILAFEARDCETALFHFEHSGPQVETDPLAASEFAQCLLSSNRPGEALRVLGTASAAHPQNSDVLYNLAVAQEAAGRLQDAIRTLDQLVARASPPPAALSLLGVYRAAAGDLEAALPLLEQAIAAGPSDERPYLDYGILATKHGNWTRASEIAAAGLSRVPDSARLHSLRGAALSQLGQTETAISEFDAADRLEPRRSFGAAGQGVLWTEQGRPEDAVTSLRAAMKSRPSDPVLAYLLAGALLRSSPDAMKEPRQLLEFAIRSRPQFPRAHALLGKLYRASGLNARAIAQLEVALLQDPGNRQALQQLVIAFREAGRNEEAAETAARLRSELTGRQRVGN